METTSDMNAKQDGESETSEKSSESGVKSDGNNEEEETTEKSSENGAKSDGNNEEEEVKSSSSEEDEGG